MPKVAKRSATVPKSPQLGARRTDMGNFTVGVDSSNLKFDKTYGKNKNKNKVGGLTLRNTNANIHPKPSTTVKKSALSAKPFTRLAGGAEASRKREEALREQKEMDFSVITAAQNSFVARPLPVTTVKPVIVTDHSILGYGEEEEGRGGRGDISALTEVVEEGRGDKVHNKSLRSTIRAQERQNYDRRRDRSSRSRKAKLEMTLNKLAEVTRNELGALKEGLKEVMPTAGMR